MQELESLIAAHILTPIAEFYPQFSGKFHIILMAFVNSVFHGLLSKYQAVCGQALALALEVRNSTISIYVIRANQTLKKITFSLSGRKSCRASRPAKADRET